MNPAVVYASATGCGQTGLGPVRMLDFPFKASATPAAIPLAPRLGEHAAEVLRELGLDAAAQIRRLADAKAIALGRDG